MSRTAGYQPPLFSNFGKDAKDLFKKTFDFENQIVVKNIANNDIAVETRIVSPNEAPLRGVFKSTIPVRNAGTLNGTFESEFHTVADKESKTSYKFNSIVKGVNFKVGLTGVKADVKGETPDFPEGWASVEADYAQEYFAGSAAVRTNGSKTLADVVLALGYDNLSVGGKVTIDTASKAAPTDYNFGAQIVGNGFVATGLTEKKRTALTLSYFQRVDRNQVVGASATFGIAKPTRSLTFGTDYKVDIDTLARAYVKIDSSKDVSTVGLSVTHRLANPKVELGVATEYNVSQASAPQAAKFGVTVTAGDF
jgi:hypothetical protein